MTTFETFEAGDGKPIPLANGAELHLPGVIGDAVRDFSGFGEVLVMIVARPFDRRRGAATVVVEQSSDGESWSTVEELEFSAEEIQFAAADAPSAFLRARCAAMTGSWRFYVDAIPVKTAGGGGGGGSDSQDLEDVLDEGNDADGQQIKGLGAASDPGDAVRLDQLPPGGTPSLEDVLDAGNDGDGNQIKNIGAASDPGDAVRLDQLPSPPGAPTLENVLIAGNDADGAQMKNVGAGTDPDDAAIVSQLPATPDLEAVLATGNDGGGAQIKNLAEGTDPGDAATVSQLGGGGGGGAEWSSFVPPTIANPIVSQGVDLVLEPGRIWYRVDPVAGFADMVILSLIIGAPTSVGGTPTEPITLDFEDLLAGIFPDAPSPPDVFFDYAVPLGYMMISSGGLATPPNAQYGPFMLGNDQDNRKQMLVTDQAGVNPGTAITVAAADFVGMNIRAMVFVA